MSKNPTISTEQMNEAIALFMGYRIYDWALTRCVVINENKDSIPVSRLDYDTNWATLMPVVEKIEGISDEKINKVWVAVNGKTCSMWTYWEVSDVLRSREPFGTYKVKVTKETKIAAVCEAVYQFIQWYQTNKQKDNGNENI